MPKIIDEHYRRGSQAFEDGATIRSVVEQVWQAGDTDDEDDRIGSFVVGYADALLTLLRRPLVCVDATMGNDRAVR